MRVSFSFLNRILKAKAEKLCMHSHVYVKGIKYQGKPLSVPRYTFADKAFSYSFGLKAH